MKKNIQYQISNIKYPNQKGFTFVELILYVSLLSIILSALIPFTWSIIEGSAKSSAQQEVFANARYISERIKYEIRRASGVTTVSTTSISLTNFSPDTTTVISLTSGNIQINLNSTGFVPLNSSKTTITSATLFNDYRSGTNSTKNIEFVFTIDDNYAGPRQEYKVTPVTVEGDAEVRSN